MLWLDPPKLSCLCIYDGTFHLKSITIFLYWMLDENFNQGTEITNKFFSHNVTQRSFILLIGWSLSGSVILSPLQLSICFYLLVQFLSLSWGFSSLGYHILCLLALEITQDTYTCIKSPSMRLCPDIWILSHVAVWNIWVPLLDCVSILHQKFLERDYSTIHFEGESFYFLGKTYKKLGVPLMFLTYKAFFLKKTKKQKT